LLFKRVHLRRYVPAKMKGKSAADVSVALERLDKMKGGSMKPELKQWLVQRLNILTQIKEAK
jgi:hypothetical protein